MCTFTGQVFNVEATGQYRKLFKLYDITGTGATPSLEVDSERIDVREVRNKGDTFSQNCRMSDYLPSFLSVVVMLRITMLCSPENGDTG